MDEKKDKTVEPLTGGEVVEPVTVSEQEIRDAMASLEGFSLEKMTRAIGEMFGITEQEAEKIANKYVKERKVTKGLEVTELNVGKDKKDPNKDDMQK